MSDQTPGGQPPEPPTPPESPPEPVSPPSGGSLPPGPASAPGAVPPGSMPPPPGAMPPPPGAMPPGYGGPAYRPPGYGMPGPGMGYAQPRPSTPGMAVAGFICSIVGLFPVAPIVLSVVGIVLSVLGRKQARQTHAPTGLATAGLWIGIAGAVLWTIGVILYIVFIIAVASSDSWNSEWETTTYTILPLLF